ncbi:MAG: nucleotidyltransferase domain-containing protein [Oligoflexia bacterium]|nr:nucleotidyltransferase domain-containing protein [Oligoflexia bacterium]
MRLSNKEQQSIVSCITLLDPHSKVYLYGSRVDDNKRGGDIDILIVSETLNFQDKLKILVCIEKKIGEQKIDILISKAADVSNNTFIQTFFNEAILLNP